MWADFLLLLTVIGQTGQDAYWMSSLLIAMTKIPKKSKSRKEGFIWLRV